MIKLSRGRATILWLGVAAMLFAASGSAWRDLVSSPAGTIVHVSVNGNDLVPSIRALALLALLFAMVSLFANRLVILVLSSLATILALLALILTLGKLGPGPDQVGVTAHFFWLPEVVGFLSILIALALSIVTSVSAKGWAVARYRSAEQKHEKTPLDMWRAQDIGVDLTGPKDE
jgi:hypothetical protein